MLTVPFSCCQNQISPINSVKIQHLYTISEDDEPFKEFRIFTNILKSKSNEKNYPFIISQWNNIFHEL